MKKVISAPHQGQLTFLGWAIILCLTKTSDGGADLSNCRKSLGMQSGVIPDQAISASSSYDAASVGPSNARIRTERNGGAWCPKQQISKNVYEWIEVDLQELKVVTQVETQGRFGNGQHDHVSRVCYSTGLLYIQGQEYAEAYMLEYKRRDIGPWIRFRDRKGSEIFTGNSNTYIAELREINPQVIARRIRVIPYSSHPRTVCMRLELYGCPWRDGVLSYSMPQGERRGTEVDLYDFTYDGTISDTYLTGGLGQLTDGAEGHSNFRLDPDQYGKKGYEWVGWKNETTDQPPIRIIFEFDKVRNFTAIRFHCNNMFSKEVRVFRKALLYFSLNGVTYADRPIVYEYMRDTLIEFARNVIINIPHRIGKYIKVELYFDARWMMLSEVRFDSDIATGNFTDEHLSAPPTKSDPENTSEEKEIIKNTKPNSFAYLNDQLIGIVVGAVGIPILLLVAIVVFCLICHRQIKYKNGANKLSGNDQTIKHNLADSSSDIPLKKFSANGNGFSYNNIMHDTEKVFYNGSLTTNLYMPNDTVGRESCKTVQTRQLPEIPKIPVESADYLSDTNTSTYAVPDVGPGSASYGTTSHPYMLHSNAMNISEYNEAGQFSTLYQQRLAFQDVADGRVYSSAMNPDQTWRGELTVMEFPRASLRFLEKLGEGLFGEVHLCESDLDMGLNDLSLGRNKNATSLVAVKVLSKNASGKMRENFIREAKIMSRLNDPNIVSILGICTADEPLCVIIEYMIYGDLYQFLKSHVAYENSLARNMDTKTLSYGCLIYMATQIASGMKFLETMNVVHRDLAARNCLVGPQFTIKISDFGMSRSLYSADYYRVEGKAVLPIRWMAWESVLLGKFSSKSDVWSFGVTVWEVLTFAHEQPYEGLSDEQVIENCGHCYHGDQQQICLSPPPNCPKEIFDLMVQCWNRDETQRPTFREIHMFLQRKNMGYNAMDEEQFYS